MKAKICVFLVKSLIFNIFLTFCVSKDDLKKHSIFEKSLCVPIEIKKYLKENKINDIYRLGIVLKKQHKFDSKNDKVILYSIKCFKYIIAQYCNQVPLYNKKSKKILANCYYQVAKLNYKMNDKEQAFINFLIAKDLDANVSKYIKGIDTENILGTLYKTGSFFYKKEESLNPKVTNKNFNIAFKCFEYVIARCTSPVDASTDKWNSYKRLNKEILAKSFYQIGMLSFKLGDYHFAEKQLKSAIILGSDITKQFIMSQEWTDKRAFPCFKSYY